MENRDFSHVKVHVRKPVFVFRFRRVLKLKKKNNFCIHLYRIIVQYVRCNYERTNPYILVNWCLSFATNNETYNNIQNGIHLEAMLISVTFLSRKEMPRTHIQAKKKKKKKSCLVKRITPDMITIVGLKIIISQLLTRELEIFYTSAYTRCVLRINGWNRTLIFLR
ncbi:hypothetical protein PGB90_003439 [Kerria lacca]